MEVDLPHDTTPSIEAVLIKGYRSMMVARKVAIVFDLNQTVQQLAASGVRRRYPSAGEREVALRVASR